MVIRIQAGDYLQGLVDHAEGLDAPGSGIVAPELLEGVGRSQGLQGQGGGGGNGAHGEYLGLQLVNRLRRISVGLSCIFRTIRLSFSPLLSVWFDVYHPFAHSFLGLMRLAALAVITIGRDIFDPALALYFCDCFHGFFRSDRYRLRSRCCIFQVPSL